MKSKMLVAVGLCILIFSVVSSVYADISPGPISGAQAINPQALKMAFKAYQWADKQGYVHNKQYLTIVDFDQDSAHKRLHIIDLKAKKVVLNTYVAQGKGTGWFKAVNFSNRFGTRASSLGVYTTGQAFYGHHGLALKVRGLEKGINANANARTVEIHPAWYVSPSFIEKQGRAGNSYGCFAVGPQVSKEIIAMIKNGSVLFAYAQQEDSDPNLS